MSVLSNYQQALGEHLRQFLTPERLLRFEEVLEQRTRWLTAVMFNVHLGHNLSAVMRSCDACGVQDAHVVEAINPFATNAEIALGSEKWLTLHRYAQKHANEECLRGLRQKGYRIVATTPAPDAQPIDQLSIDRPVALLFGNEKVGVPEEMIAAADETVVLPMVGFVESFNISVAAALCLFDLSRRIRASTVTWQLTQDEKERLRFDWTCRSVHYFEPIERRFQEQWTKQAGQSPDPE